MSVSCFARGKGTAVVDTRGTVYEWGAHVDGGLMATTVTGQDVVQVVCGKDSTFALDSHV